MELSENESLLAGTDKRYQDGSYLAANESWHAEDSAWKAAKVLDILRRNGVQPSTLAEVGCGAGEILVELSRQLPKCSFVGYDISADAAELWKGKSGPRLRYEHADLLEVEDHFDALLCMDVFEHVEDYMGFLREVRAKAGYQVFHIPLDLSVSNLSRELLTVKRERVGHLHYFTRETALATLGDTGYTVLDWNYTLAFKELPATSGKQRMAVLPRKALFALSQDWGQRLIGGAALMVLAR